jgi:hypothetical protein
MRRPRWWPSGGRWQALGQHSEFFRQFVPASRSDGDDQQCRRSSAGDSLAQAAPRDDSERPAIARTRCRRTAVYAGRSAALRPTVLQQPALLAGVLRYQSTDSRDVRRSRLSGADAYVRSYRNFCTAATRSRRAITRQKHQQLDGTGRALRPVELVVVRRPPLHIDGPWIATCTA